MALDSIQQWTVQGVQAHPLHIHINPMQIQSFMRDGAALNSTCDEDYGFLCHGSGDFVDTLQVPDTQGTAGARAIVRYPGRVADYTGEQTLHCHYLVHEDQGCLTYAKILPAQRKAGERG
jgi:FtsP/CotA-like multicopper oxidase with cupredoxin domain